MPIETGEKSPTQKYANWKAPETRQNKGVESNVNKAREGLKKIFQSYEATIDEASKLGAMEKVDTSASSNFRQMLSDRLHECDEGQLESAQDMLQAIGDKMRLVRQHMPTDQYKGADRDTKDTLGTIFNYSFGGVLKEALKRNHVQGVTGNTLREVFDSYTSSNRGDPKHVTYRPSIEELFGKTKSK